MHVFNFGFLIFSDGGCPYYAEISWESVCFHVFSNIASDWMTAVMLANQKLGLTSSLTWILTHLWLDDTYTKWYGGHRWYRYPLLGTWRHQVITQMDADLTSMRTSQIHQNEISKDISVIRFNWKLFFKMSYISSRSQWVNINVT